MAAKFVCLFLIMGLLASPSMAVQYDVGGILGWDLGVDLNIWLLGKQFHVGDVLHFKYNNLLHNVVRLDGEVAFSTCNTALKLFVDASGDLYFTLTQAGDYYFCSSLLTDCLLNLKLKVSVLP